MLHKGSSFYRGERSDDLLKLKPLNDAEARVIGYVAGKGKYEGLTGALEVETPEGMRFKIGSGLDGADRHDPPALGSWITYSYEGTTRRGIPRFARFVRVRKEE
jgi:DNA ligase-1